MTDQGPRPFLYSMRKLCVIPEPPPAARYRYYYIIFARGSKCFWKKIQMTSVALILSDFLPTMNSGSRLLPPALV